MRCFRWSLGCLLIAAGPLLAADTKPADSKATQPTQPAKPEAAEKYVPIVGSVPAIVSEINTETKVLKLKVTLRKLVPNPDVQADLLNQQGEILAKQQEISQTEDPIERQQRLVELYQAVLQKGATAQGLFQIEETPVDVECNFNPADVKVRLHQLPPHFDSQGRVAKYTAEEIKKARGPDKTLLGYTGELEDVKEGQSVLVHMKRKMIAKPGDTKIPPRYTLAKENPYAAIIYIVKDAP